MPVITDGEQDTFNSKLERANWEFVYGAAHYFFNARNPDKGVRADKIFVTKIPEELALEIIEHDFEKPCPVNYDVSKDWKHPSVPLAENVLTTEHIHFEFGQSPRVIKAAEILRIEAQNYYRTYLKLAKVRLIKIKPGFFGEWHRDQFPAGLHKVLIYLSGASESLGTTEIKIGGQIYKVEGNAGVSALFDTNGIEHRACGAKNEGHWRYSMECTFAPAFHDQVCNFPPISPLTAAWPRCDDASYEAAKKVYIQMGAGGGARKPDMTVCQPILEYNYKNPPKYVNIGGGSQFLEQGWANVDGAFGELNPYPTQFDVNMSLGFQGDSIDLVYTSHTFEHIDQMTFCRMMSEISRILKTGGLLFIKVPAVDRCIKEIVSGELSSGMHRCLCGVQRTWGVYGVSFSSWQILSFLICSAWNEQYSDDIFNQSDNRLGDGGYFGPAPNIDDEELRYLAGKLTPNQLASFLKVRFQTYQKSSATTWKWGHHNAWSTEELVEQVSQYGFNAISSDRDKILNSFGNPPRFFLTQRDISIWTLFKKI